MFILGDSVGKIFNETIPHAMGALKMRVRKIRVLENASTLVSTENASTEYASTVDRPGKCEYTEFASTKSCIDEVK